MNPPEEQRFLDLISGNRPRILKVCRVYAWNVADRDDLYQEILFQIWRALPGLKQDIHANTWLYRIAINTSISFVRKRAARGGPAVPLDHEQLTHHIESRQTHDDGAEEQLARLYDAIAQLNEVEKALVTLFLEDCSYEQMAEVLGLGASNVGVMLHRAKRKLSTLMKESS
ncbi:MAG: RNA polymerase sigma factor [Verrucomicrobia bacterium]|nr:RNA polymerase sigma factor [Verrucomicrobiota bacterium]